MGGRGRKAGAYGQTSSGKRSVILSSEGRSQVGPQWGGGSAGNKVAWWIARAAVTETQTIDRIWASFHPDPPRFMRLILHMQFVSEHLACFFSMG